MSVSLPGRRPAVNTIAGPNPQQLRMKPEMKVWVEHPVTGERAKVTISNARDMVERRRGADKWAYASAMPQINPMPSIAEQKRVDALEEARELLRAAGELPPESDDDDMPPPSIMAPPEMPTITPGAGGDPDPDPVAAAAEPDADEKTSF